MNFLEIDNTIAKEIIHVTLEAEEKVLSRVAINVKNIVSIDYVEE